MPDREFSLDMTMMLTIHNAFRRELDRMLRIVEHADDDPKQVLRAAIGWQLFKRYLRIHHTSEDEMVWGPMEQQLSGRSDDLSVLAAMEAEHAAIDPLLEQVDAGLADRDGGLERLGELVDQLASSLVGHLSHEESDGLQLVDATLSEQQWAAFARLHIARVGDEVGTYLPWLLDGESAEWTEKVLSGLPPHGRTSYEGAWRVAYAGLDLWAPAHY